MEILYYSCKCPTDPPEFRRVVENNLKLMQKDQLIEELRVNMNELVLNVRDQKSKLKISKM